ncbi:MULTISPECIES: hypothetical protein [Streptomyces]|uniref:Uncharacterized protein n=2 Tax=Streptomyces TaxID=1883 RepID=A0A3R7J6G6_9ACTN|nr:MULTISPECIES: hypothetical protein [Streptomyces]MZE76487.1 hypothetical protein [Streptomyces sp. SID5475]KNE81476.1 hypothetical protein ADZ36_16410 [Streptomyces fradiae]OFA62731.1 hypothetical protein BEN35_00040 [Streptomyces fradiae]PQM24192.1 hypothetical protein Sfr7A_05180 [Streptomyces xinghaiensis]RKM97156.1 hypothetical protein SFRA_007870 [Streptomyces xinghaiensis]
MAAVAWLLIPVVAAVAAGVWARWAARKRKTGDVAELAGYARFREAMERPGSAPGPAASDRGPASGSDAA